jgi:hypothetical protein
MRRLYKMSPRCNNGRFATPKQNPRGVCQIAPEQPLIGGSLTGYGGGLERKRWLLDYEREPRLQF